MTERNIDLVLHHLTRVEGHGNINIKVSNGVVEKCEWSIPEARRFFEAMALGRQCGEIHHITSRICGICSIGHTIASLRATESAMGITLNDQDLKLRKLALNAETLQSHILHLGFLVLPDLMSVGSVIPLSSSNPDEVKTLLRLHRTANEMSKVVCGRTTHPQRLVLGGFSKIPSIKELRTLKQNLAEVAKDLESVVDLIIGLSKKFPDFVRETEFISLSNPNEYPFYDGELTSSDTGMVPKSEYLSYTNEYIVANSTAKRAKHARESYMVGALARLNNNYDQLSSKAKKTAEKIDLHPMCHNPFMNNMAQLVEIVHCVEESIKQINDLESSYKNQPEYNNPDITIKAGRGIGVIEVPRGILFHDYTYNNKGICMKANFVIPTNQNHGNIELDMKSLLPKIIDKADREVELTIEMLVRAYDPCISCSTH